MRSPNALSFVLLITAIIAQCALARFPKTCSGKRSESCSCGQDDLTEDYWVYCGKSSSLDDLKTVLDDIKKSGLEQLKSIWTNGLQLKSGEQFSADLFQDLKFPDFEMLDCGDIPLEISKDAFDQTKEVLTTLFFKNCKFAEDKIPEALGQLPKLKYMILENMGLKKIEKNEFSGNEALEQLYLTNNTLESISESALEPLKNLKVLYLNQISQFKPSLLQQIADGLPGLKILNLDSTKLKDVSGISLAGLANLTTLSMNRAKIQSIAPGFFDGLNKLKTLSLSKNRINEITPNVFDGLENLEMLDLSSNYLTKVIAPSFKGLKNLKHLKLGQNKFPTLSNFAFNSLRNLEILDLSKNRELTRLGPKAFANLNNLRELILQKSKLQSLNSAMQNIQNLNLLDISGTDITTIADDEFQGTVFLRSLLMNDTFVEAIGRKLLDSLDALTYLDVSGNSYFCDITIVDIITEILNREDRNNLFIANKDTTYCDFPRELSGKNLFDLEQVKEFVLPKLEEQGSLDVIALLFSFLDGDISACSEAEQIELLQCEQKLETSGQQDNPDPNSERNDVATGIAEQCQLLSVYAECMKPIPLREVCNPAPHRVKKVVQELLCAPDFGQIGGKELECIISEADRFEVNPCITRLVNKVKVEYKRTIISKGVVGLSCDIIQQAQRCIRPVANNCSNTIMLEVEKLADAFMTALVGGEHSCQISSPSSQLTQEILEGDLSDVELFAPPPELSWDDVDALEDSADTVFETIETALGVTEKKGKGGGKKQKVENDDVWQCGSSECESCTLDENCKTDVGTYSDEESCEIGCAKPNEPEYICNQNGRCESCIQPFCFSLVFGNKKQCNAACSKLFGQTGKQEKDERWQCGSPECQSCRLDRSECLLDVGAYSDKETCQIECAKPIEPLYFCDNGKCETCIDPFCPDRPFADKKQCTTICSKLSGNPGSSNEKCLPEDQYPDFCKKVLKDFSVAEFCQFRDSSSACSKTCCDARRL